MYVFSSCPGVLGRSADDIAAVFEALLTNKGIERMRQADPHVVPVPWNELEYRSTRKLRIGYYVDDGYMTASPACQRAVRVAVEAFKAEGHHVEEFRVDHMSVDIPTCIATFMALISSGTEHIIKLLENEPVAPFLKKLMQMGRLAPVLPHAIRTQLLPWVVRQLRQRFWTSSSMRMSQLHSTHHPHTPCGK